MLFNRLTLLVCSIFIRTIITAQGKEPDVKFGDITPADFKPVNYSIDTSADAVYLYDAGSSHYETVSPMGLTLIYKEHKRIRLLHRKSFNELATIKIYLFKHGYNSDELEDLQASTYTFENGKVVENKVDKNSIFRNKDGDAQVVTFTFPNVKEGCIVEYSFEKNIPAETYIPSWSFQSSYPHLWSEYTVEVPEFLDFVTLNQGYLKPVIDTGSSSARNFYAGKTFRSTTTKHTWAFENVPPLKGDKYITSLSNYQEGIEFQLHAIRIPGEQPKFIFNDWYETVEQLMTNEYFGQDLVKENNWLKDHIQSTTQNEPDSFNRSRKIYESVRNNYSCINHSAITLWQPIKKTFETKKGNVADINILLVAMLRYAGFIADPVLLSTRANGKTYDEYPILSKYNYVVARLELGDQVYLLDAADKNLGFGFLPPECFNGNAMIIAQPPLPINLSSDSLHESNLVSMFLSNDDNGTISGTYTSVLGNVESYNLRDQVSQSSKDEYLKDIKSKFGFDVNIKNAVIDSLELREEPVSIQYDLSFKPDADVIYFNPMLTEAEKENPFKAAQRAYPVEMPYCIDKTYILNMEVPAGYTVDELPKPARITLNENEGLFEYLIQQTGDHVQLQCRVKLNKANFEPGDYETLRNFYSLVIESENQQIVFKKQ